MGGFGHSEVSSTWGIPSPSYIKSDAYHKAIKWFLHHMNDMVFFKRYTRSSNILELNILIAFSLLITIGEVCMFKSETSLLGVNNVIE
jgi:hypothetical protein